MKFIACLEGQEYALEVRNSKDKAGFYEVSLDNKLFKINSRDLGSGLVSLILDHKSYSIDIEKTNLKDPLDGGLKVKVRGKLVNLYISNRRQKNIRDANLSKSAHQGQITINAPMPGKIISLKVKRGDKIKEGQSLLIIEAMKMENEIKSPKEGLIEEIFVKVGDPVESGLKLLQIRALA